MNFKHYLLKKYQNSLSDDGLNQLIIDYARLLGNVSEDVYSSLMFLDSFKDEDISGDYLYNEGNFFLWNEDGYHWFKTSVDALYFVNPLSAIFSTQDFNRSFIDIFDMQFKQYSRRWKEGYFWLEKADFDIRDELIQAPKRVYCETRNIEFETREEAARWLFNAGFAASEKGALSQLNKHLMGATQACYKLRFSEW